MFIKEIVIDGFKSYARRTEIEGFDPHFNAITGLNGSGKSNILDAICFVLGITNLSQVRAGNLSELVYKQGQAGVNKAVVTVVFDNEDEASSPVGYEQCSTVAVTRQVLLGGKSKYLINGRNTPAGQVQNLFHTVQLNVNNPHFLIMQGRITKVLNMKATEILGMVEEAAGTRMYETKRLAALKTIDKKQTKLEDLNSVLADEITPTLERLRGEKQSYLQWSKNSADLERIERFVVAYEYAEAEKLLTAQSSGEQQLRKSELETTAQGLQEHIDEKEKEIKARTGKLKGDFAKKFSDTKSTEQKLSNDLVRVTSKWRNAKDTVASASADVEAAKKVVHETKDQITAKQAEIQTEEAAISEVCQAAKDAEEKLAKLTEEYQKMSAGISEDCSLPEQIARAHSESKSAEGKVQQAHMKITHLKKELKIVEASMKKEKQSSEKLATKCDKLQKAVEKLDSDIAVLNFSESEYNEREQTRQKMEGEVSDLEEVVESLKAQLGGRLAFKYADPVRGFDRSKVKGLVAKLVAVKESKHATALEVVAGGKLYQVVVDEAITAKALLQRGKLQKRVTIIPLDKVTSRGISQNAVDRAKSTVPEGSTASPAIELVGFDEEVRTAVEYVFGSTLIVDGSAKSANDVCNATKTKTVTLQGDVYDPSGTISGGSSGSLGSLLSKLSTLAESESALEEKRQQLQAVCAFLDSKKSAAVSFDSLNAKRELALAEFDAAKNHMSRTSFGVLMEKRDEMLQELNAADTESSEMEEEKNTKWALYEQLKDQEDELTQKRESRLSNIEKAVETSKQDAALKAKQSRELELESLKVELGSAEEAYDAVLVSLEEMTAQESETQIAVGETQGAYEEVREQLDDMEKEMETSSSEVVDLRREKSDLLKRRDDAVVEAKKLSVAISQMEKDQHSAKKRVSSLLQRYPWIESESGSFGVAGGDYDFGSTDLASASRKMKALKAEQDQLAKKINKKVIGMIEKAEGEYTELLRKRKVVENDKKKIQQVIEELDVKKKSELQRTWVKVNRDFGSIFSTLLPGASAKLEPPEGMEAWEGLEVKVGFGEVWKESLSELSGGQRSLLALSLILSLLLFKPAPMYILDEVDAALDLSHTQNIGNMLKTHFSQSQFIVVSLKEGMFNNANVIFRTKFVDGVSTVTKTFGTNSSRTKNLQSTENTSTSSAAPGKRTRGEEESSKRRNGKENSVRLH